MFRFSKEPYSFFEILGAGFELVTSSFTRVWYLILITALLPLLGSLLPISSIKLDATAMNKATLIHQLPGFLIYFGYLIVALFLLSMVIYRMYMLGFAKKPNFLSTASAVSKRFLVLFLAAVIMYVLIVAVFTISSVHDVLAIMLTALLLIFLLVFFSVLLPIVLFELKGPIGSVINSFRLVWGSWWSTFGVLVLPILVFTIVYYGATHYILQLHVNHWLFAAWQIGFGFIMKIYLYALCVIIYYNLTHVTIKQTNINADHNSINQE